MKVLLVNKFLYPKGGDAISTKTTGRLLEERGHQVAYWGMDHPDNPNYPNKEDFVPFVDYHASGGMIRQIRQACNILYSVEAKRRIASCLNTFKPDIVHLNNFAHQLSPSILSPIAKRGIPVVMTMRDYKLVCPAYSMLVNGQPCERCTGRRYYHCLLNKCTKGSYAKSLINCIEMYLHHRLLRIYDLIDSFISPSQFLKDKCREMGFRREIVHLPNCVNLDDYTPCYTADDDTIVYVGRVSHEKGIDTLVTAARELPLQLKIIGDGPLREPLQARVDREGTRNVSFLGHMSPVEVKSHVQRAMAVVVPSECYENNPRTVIESFALGKPVVGARIGGIPELVTDDETGYTFTPGDVDDLRHKIQSLSKDADTVIRLGRRARQHAEANFGSETHYQKLMTIYQTPLQARHA